MKFRTTQYDISYDRQRDMLKNLAKKFVKEVCGND